MKKEIHSKMTIEFVYSDGSRDSFTGDSTKIKNRFNRFVDYALSHYVDGFREVRLYDSANHVFRSFKQHF